MKVVFNPLTGKLDFVGGGAGGSITGSGAANRLTYWTGASVVSSDSAFTIDPTNNVLNLGSLAVTELKSATINDNQVSAAVLLTFAHATYKRAVLKYSIERDVNSLTGLLIITTDGTSVSFSDEYSELNDTGVSLDVDVSGANVRVLYTSTNTGSSGTFKYSLTSWL